jgi:hypothetical protein
MPTMRVRFDGIDINGFSVDDHDARRIDQIFSLIPTDSGISVAVSLPLPDYCLDPAAPHQYWFPSERAYGFTNNLKVPALTVAYDISPDGHQFDWPTLVLSNATNTFPLSHGDAAEICNDSTSEVGKAIRLFTILGNRDALLPPDVPFSNRLRHAHDYFLTSFRRDVTRWAKREDVPVLWDSSRRYLGVTGPCRDLLERFNVGQIGALLQGISKSLLEDRLTVERMTLDRNKGVAL